MNCACNVMQVEEFSEGESDSGSTGNTQEQEAAQFGWFDDLFIFDTSLNSWAQPLQLNKGCPTPRAAHGMTSVDNYIVIFGGRDCGGRLNDLHLFDTG